jgi:hypothetical protein
MWLHQHPKQDAHVDTPSPDGVDTGEWVDFHQRDDTPELLTLADTIGVARRERSAAGTKQPRQLASGPVARHLVQAHRGLTEPFDSGARPAVAPGRRVRYLLSQRGDHPFEGTTLQQVPFAPDFPSARAARRKLNPGPEIPPSSRHSAEDICS